MFLVFMVALLIVGAGLYASALHPPAKNDAYQEYTNSPREFYFLMLTLEAGRVTSRANLELVESIIQRIRNKEIPQRLTSHENPNDQTTWL